MTTSSRVDRPVLDLETIDIQVFLVTLEPAKIAKIRQKLVELYIEILDLHMMIVRNINKKSRK